MFGHLWKIFIAFNETGQWYQQHKFNLSLTSRFRLLDECLCGVTGDAHLLDVLRTRFFSGFDGVVPEEI